MAEGPFHYRNTQGVRVYVPDAQVVAEPGEVYTSPVEIHNETQVAVDPDASPVAPAEPVVPEPTPEPVVDPESAPEPAPTEEAQQ